MASVISQIPKFYQSLLNTKHSSIPLDSKRILGWKCGKCEGVWREGVSKRVNFDYCPRCTPNKGRTAKVSGFVAEINPSPIDGKTITCGVCVLSTPWDNDMIVCPICKFESCKNCYKKYLVDSVSDAITLGGSRCMNVECSNVFDVKFLEKTFLKKWTYGKAKGEYQWLLKLKYVQLEKAKIPSTIPLVPLIKQRKALRPIIYRLAQQIKVLEWEVDKAETCFDRHRFGELLEAKLERLEEKEEEKYRLEQIIYEGLGNSNTITVNYIQGCPVESCRGLINSKYKCEVCNCSICDKCRVSLNLATLHICNPDDVETVKSLAGNTRPCPKCGAGIYKIDGCDQMFCVGCKTAFSWETGKVERGAIHNPHHFEWKRSEAGTGGIIPNGFGPNPLDGGCGVLPDYELLTDKLMIELRDFELELIGRLFEFASTYSLSSIRQGIRDHNKHLIHLRIKYISGEMGEDEWSRKVYFVYRDMKLLETKYDVYDSVKTLLIEKLSDFNYSLFKDDETEDNCEKLLIPPGAVIRTIYVNFIDEIERIRCYFNEVIERDYDGVVSIINKGWDTRAQRTHFSSGKRFGWRY